MPVYTFDANNRIHYEVIEDIILMKFLFFDNPSTLSARMKYYFDFFASLPGMLYLGSFPGTINPVVAKAGLDVIKSYGYNYRIFYNLSEITDLSNFELTVLNPASQRCLARAGVNITQSACNGPIAQFAKSINFGDCAVYSPLRGDIQTVKTPIKYYKINPDNSLTDEFDELPQDGFSYYGAVRLRPMMANNRVVLENGKPRYYPRS
jgi:hypothetical protein